jgi:hypothetical protein
MKNKGATCAICFAISKGAYGNSLPALFKIKRKKLVVFSLGKEIKGLWRHEGRLEKMAILAPTSGAKKMAKNPLFHYYEMLHMICA